MSAWWWPFSEKQPPVERDLDYFKIATIAVADRQCRGHRYKNAENTIIQGAAWAFLAPNEYYATETLVYVLEESERTAQEFFWDGSERLV